MNFDPSNVLRILAEKRSPFVFISKNYHRDPVYRLCKMVIFDANLTEIRNFLNASYFLYEPSYLCTVMNILRLKKYSFRHLFRKIVIEITVYRLCKWSFLMPIWQNIWNFLKCLEFFFNLYSWLCYEHFKPKNVSPFVLISKNFHWDHSV